MLLALDIATKTGYCSPDCSGTIDLSKGGLKHTNLYNFIWDMHAAHSLEVIAVERTAGAHKNALIVMSRLRGIVELFAEKNDIKVVEYSPGTIKKFFTGSGAAKKDEMMARFESINGKPPVDDNEADAFALFSLAAKDEFPSEQFEVLK